MRDFFHSDLFVVILKVIVVLAVFSFLLKMLPAIAPKAVRRAVRDYKTVPDSSVKKIYTGEGEEPGRSHEQDIPTGTPWKEVSTGTISGTDKK